MGEIDRLSYMSRLRPADPAAKALYSAGSLLICLWADRLPVSLFVFCANLFWVCVGGRTPIWRYMRLLLIPALFFLLTCAMVAVEIGRGPDGLYVAIPGTDRALSLFAKGMGCVSCLFALALSTPVGQIMGILRRLHMPQLLSELMLLMYRSIFILGDTAADMRRSIISRGGDRSMAVAMRAFVRMIPSLFVLSMRRAARLYDAMEARGYEGGEIRLLEQRTDFPCVYRWLAAGYMIILLAAAVRIRL